MSSKKVKAKTKKVSQNDLRKMMNEIKSKRTNETSHTKVTRDGHSLLNNPDAYKKALRDRMKVKALLGEEKVDLAEKNEENISELAKSLSNKSESSKPLKRPLSTKIPISDMTMEIEKGPDTKVAKIETPDKKNGGLLLGDYGSDSEEDVESQKEEEKEQEEMSTEEPKPQESSLPEGFFDDPELDAKMRGVETPAHVMDREWEEFQREIQRETGQSEQIVEEEQELGKVDREIEEIDEQIMHLSKVEKLNVVRDKAKQNLVKKKLENAVSESEEEDSGSEDIEEDFLSWREKER